MSEFIPWIAAEAESKPNVAAVNLNSPTERPAKRALAIHNLPAHQFPAKRFAATNVPSELTADVVEAQAVETVAPVAAESAWEDPLDRNPDLWLYRKRTIALLRRYLRYSLETGRLPSILGCEFFRTAVTNYSVSTFEDRVVFVHDVEHCLQKLDESARGIVGCVILQEHNYDSASRRLHCSRSTLERRLFIALDELSEQFLAVGMLVASPCARNPDLADQDLTEHDEEEL